MDLLELKVTLVRLLIYKQQYDSNVSTQEGFKLCLRAPQTTGVFALILDSAIMSNLAYIHQGDPEARQLIEHWHTKTSLSTLEGCCCVLLKTAEYILQQDEVDLPVRFAVTTELMRRERFMEAHVGWAAIARTLAPNQRLHQRERFLVMAELTKCCNLLGLETEGEDYALRALKPLDYGATQAQIYSMQIILADSLIGQRKYDQAENVLKSVLAGTGLSAYVKMAAILRLNKVRRRLGTLMVQEPPTVVALQDLSMRRQDLTLEARNEILDELSSTHSYLEQSNDGTDAHATALRILVTMSADINIIVDQEDWRLSRIHDKVCSYRIYCELITLKYL